MSHSAKTEEEESGVLNKTSDGTKDSSQEKTKATKTSKKAVDSNDSVRQKADSTKSNEKQIELTESSPKNVSFSDSGLDKPDSSNLKKDHVDIIVKDKEAHQRCQGPKSQRQFVIWSLGGFFDFNLRYILQIRGFANIINIILGLTDIIILGLMCQLRPYAHSPSEGFFCKGAATFLFVVSCSSFFTSMLYFFCCVLSRTTDFLLFQSSFEGLYFVLYFILFMTAGTVLIISEMKRNLPREEIYETKAESSEPAGIIAVINGAVYAFNAIWFFISHCKQKDSVIEVPHLS